MSSVMFEHTVYYLSSFFSDWCFSIQKPAAIQELSDFWLSWRCFDFTLQLYLTQELFSLKYLFLLLVFYTWVTYNVVLHFSLNQSIYYCDCPCFGSLWQEDKLWKGYFICVCLKIEKYQAIYLSDLRHYATHCFMATTPLWHLTEVVHRK